MTSTPSPTLAVARPPVAPRQTVAFVGNQPFALARFRSLLIRDLAERGHRVMVLSPGWDADPVSRAQIEAHGGEPVAIAFDRSASGPAAEARSLRSIRETVRALRPDAVFSHFVKPVLYTALATAGLPVRRRVAMIEGLGVTGQQAWKQAAMATAYRAAGRAYDAWFVMNPDDESYFVSTVGLPWARVHRLEGMGIDLDEFAFVPPPAREAPTFLFVARMLAQKGVWEFVDAAAAVRQTHPGTRFVMIGGADDSFDAVDGAQLAARARAAGVEWHGHVDDVLPFLRDADVFVLPTFYREGYPRSTMEAMAVGRAVVTTDNPGSRDAVVDGVNGLLVPPRDTPALADALRSLAGAPDRLRAMGVESRRLAETRYDYRRINRVLIDALVGPDGC